MSDGHQACRCKRDEYAPPREPGRYVPYCILQFHHGNTEKNPPSTVAFDSGVSLDGCTKLHELKIRGNDLSEASVIRSITSMEIRKIIFLQSEAFLRKVSESKLDGVLCALVNRTGYIGQLEVEFRGAYFIYGDRGIVFEIERHLRHLRKCERVEVKFTDVEGNIIHSWGNPSTRILECSPSDS